MFRSLTFIYGGEEKIVPLTSVTTLEHTRMLVSASFWRTALPCSFVLKYLDEENDMITIDSDEDWREMLRHFTASSSLRIFVIATSLKTLSKPLSSSLSGSTSPVSPCSGSSSSISTVPSLSIERSSVAQGTRFVQRWVLTNNSSETWPNDCRITHQHGDRLGCFSSFGIATSVAPGQSLSLEVNFTAPTSAGSVNSTWALIDRSGVVRMHIVVQVSVFQPITPVVFPGLPVGQSFSVFPGLPYSSSNELSSQKPMQLSLLQQAAYSTTSASSFVRTALAPGARFSRRWTICNNSQSAWPEGLRARKSGTHSFGFLDNFAVPALGAGKETTIDLSLTVPNTLGEVDAIWKIYKQDGSIIEGVEFSIHLLVEKQQSQSQSQLVMNNSIASQSSSIRHPILAQVSSLSEDELSKLFNSFVSL